jgi:hypothetical protein
VVARRPPNPAGAGLAVEGGEVEIGGEMIEQFHEGEFEELQIEVLTEILKQLKRIADILEGRTDTEEVSDGRR